MMMTTMKLLALLVTLTGSGLAVYVDMPACQGSQGYEDAMIEYCMFENVFVGTINATSSETEDGDTTFTVHTTVVDLVYRLRPSPPESDTRRITVIERVEHNEHYCDPGHTTGPNKYVIKVFEELSTNVYGAIPCQPWDDCIQSELLDEINNHQEICGFMFKK